MGLIQKIFGTYSQRELKSIYPIVDKLTALEDEYKPLPAAALTSITHATASAESVFLNICFTCILCKVLYPCYSYKIYIISNHAR